MTPIDRSKAGFRTEIGADRAGILSWRGGRRAAEPWFENSAPRGWWPSLRPAELWAFREVALHLALRDLKLRYKQTVIGVAWVVLQPVIAAVIFTLTLGKLVDVPSDGIDYLVFVLAGLVPWTFVSSGTNAGAESLVDNRELVTKAYFPRILAPVGRSPPGPCRPGPGPSRPRRGDGDP